MWREIKLDEAEILLFRQMMEKIGNITSFNRPADLLQGMNSRLCKEKIYNFHFDNDMERQSRTIENLPFHIFFWIFNGLSIIFFGSRKFMIKWWLFESLDYRFGASLKSRWLLIIEIRTSSESWPKNPSILWKLWFSNWEVRHPEKVPVAQWNEFIAWSSSKDCTREGQTRIWNEKEGVRRLHGLVGPRNPLRSQRNFRHSGSEFRSFVADWSGACEMHQGGAWQAREAKEAIDNRLDQQEL